MPVQAADLIGSWIVDPTDEAGLEAFGRMAATFTEQGDLVYSTLQDFGVARMLETWRLENEELVTEQLSSPNEVRSPICLDEKGRLLLLDLGSPCVMVKDDPRNLADPDAVLFALGGRALVLGLETTQPDAAFPPVLLGTDSDGSPVHEVFAAPDLKECRAAAQKRGAQTLACAFAWEGVLSDGGTETDAVFAEASRLGREQSLLLAQCFAKVGDRVRLVGGVKVVTEERGPGWCEAAAIKGAEQWRAHKGLVADQFAYVRNYAPDFFPKEDRTDLNAECQKLLAALQRLHAEAADEKERERFARAGQEAYAAWQKYLLGEMEAGAEGLEKAEATFRGGPPTESQPATEAAAKE